MNTQMKIFNSNTSRILTCLSALCLVALSTQAATITVTSFAGIGAGTLHQALVDANDGDTINFSLPPSSGIQLYADPLIVDKSVTISGPGAANLMVLGTGGVRVFNIAPGKNVTISGLTITNGVADDAGGAIYNDHSVLTLNECNIVNNFTGGAGGAIYNNNGTLTIDNCIIRYNSSIRFLFSEGAGGGVYNNGRSGSATLTVTNSTISNNQAEGAGGGIYNNGIEGSAMLTINNCSLSGNSAGTGGGMYNAASVGSGTISITNSTLRNNSAIGSGGGIANYAADPVGSAVLTITNSTLTENYSDFSGGAIQNRGDGHGTATLTINNGTFSGNSARLQAGAIDNGAVSGGIALLTVRNSTLNANSAPGGGGITNATPLGRATLTIGSTILTTGASGNNIVSDVGDVISDGYNLSNDDGGGLLTAMGDQINTDSMLGPLQDNGGPTFTHALLPGSPAVDAGKNLTACTTDQRGPGFVRTFDSSSLANAAGGDGTDIGAYEVQLAAPSYAGQVQPPINPDGTSAFNVRRGVVPVKFNLILGGVATCDLPPATIAVTRTAGGVIGQVNESDYSGNADTGSNFRIDSCQYLYNLTSRALGVGTYRVDILINGQVVGNATFGLN
jgi:hypothetical protein